MLQLHDFTCLDETGQAIWPAMTIDLAPGELVAVVGPVGSGKTTLFRAISSLVPEFWNAQPSGQRLLNGDDISGLKPHHLAAQITMVGQSPALGFVAETVRDELAFGPAQLGYSPAEVGARVGEAAASLEIEHLLERNPFELSGGEQQLVSIAAAVSSGCRYLLLDEPLARLDESRAGLVIGVLQHLAKSYDVCIVLSAHDVSSMQTKFNQVIELGRYVQPILTAAVIEPSLTTPTRNNAKTFSLGEFDVAAGELVALTGVNGVGKTQMLERIYARLHNQISVAMVPQEAADLLIFDTVQRELSDSDKVAGGPSGGAYARLRELGFELDPAGHPRDLSAGQQLGLVLAIQLNREVDLLLLDEPNRGLDAETLELLRQNLARLAGKGTAIVVVSHDRQFLAGLADRELRLTPAGLAEVDS